MTNTSKDIKITPDWEKEFTKVWIKVMNIYAYNSYNNSKKVLKDIIRNLLAKQEEQHKAEMQSQEAKRASSIAYIIDNDKKIIDKLKQQHRAELEGLKKKEKDEYSHGALGMVDVRYEQNKGYNKAVRDNNEAITNLLEQKGK